MKGIVIYKLENVGSKSEGLFPFLYLKKGEFIKIWMKEDMSLHGDGLTAFDGKYVSIQGELNEYDVFMISEISEIEINEIM